MVAIMSGLLQRRAHFASAVVWLCAVLLLTGCRSSAWNEWNPTPVTPDPAVITVQPQSHVVRPGQSATFTVTATSDHPMTYQWNENGIAIPGATGSSYTTPPAVLGANGSTLVGTFTVIILDSITYVSSQPATLQIGPRPPARMPQFNSWAGSRRTTPWAADFPWGPPWSATPIFPAIAVGMPQTNF
jgi:hypothetical protein